MFVLAILIALILALILTPIMRIIALKFDIVDHPDASVKTHKVAIPYLGGISIFLSLILTMLILIAIFNLNVNKEDYGILAGSIIITILGFIDDIMRVSPFKKVFIQALVTIVIGLFGLRVNLIDSDIINSVLMFCWVVGLTNACNLIDIMDGLASGVIAIASFFLSFMFLQKGEIFNSLLLSALAGACLGLLKYNFNPAQIFMGDTGSLFLGFLSASMTIKFIMGEGISQTALIPVFILGIPIFETVFVSILRIKSGRSPLKGSKDHFALRLVKSGFTVKQAVLITYLVGSLLGIVAVISYNFRDIVLYIGIGLLLYAFVVYRKLSKIDMSNF